MSKRKSIKSISTTKSQRLGKMKSTAKKVSTGATRSVLTTKRLNINALTRKMGVMTIPKDIETRGTIMSTNGTVLTVKLSHELMRKLKDIYRMTGREGIEFAGLVECTFDVNYTKFNSPTIRTDGQEGWVNLPRRTGRTKLMYHSHPSPEGTGRSTIVTFPSSADLRIYVDTHKDGILEGNLILDQQGVYVVDVLRPVANFSGEDMFAAAVRELNRKKAFDYQVRGEMLALNVDIKRWKAFVNSDLDSKMIRMFGVSIKYYTWADVPTVRISSLSR